MHALTAAGLVRQWRYATMGPGVPCYYTLSPESYRLLYGHDAILPGHRAFEPLSNSRQQHTRALADFIVHTAIAAHQVDFAIADFQREGSLRLQVGPDFLYPDCTFRLITPDGRTFDFFTELDNGTETVHTQDGHGSFEHKIRFYEAYKDQCKALGKDHRFRVLFVATGTGKRLGHLLARSKELLRLKHRPLIYGVILGEYLDNETPLTSTCFLDNCDEQRALVPRAPIRLSPTALAAAVALAKVGPL